jgi:UDP-glucose 4-epimerase
MPRTSRSICLLGDGGVIGKMVRSTLLEDPAITNVVSIGPVRPHRLQRKISYHEMDLAADNADNQLSDIIDAEDIDTLLYMGYLSDFGNAELDQANEVRQIISALDRRHVPKAVFASTTAVYGALPTHPTHLVERTPLATTAESEWVQDKVKAEQELNNFLLETDIMVTTLRFALVLGPTVQNFMTDYLGQRSVPIVRNLDPPLQFVHEQDVSRAYCQAVRHDVEGSFNIVGDGALPLSVGLRIGRRRPSSVPELSAAPLSQILWEGDTVEPQPVLADMFTYIWVADGGLASTEMNFQPLFSTKETIESFYRSRREN